MATDDLLRRPVKQAEDLGFEHVSGQSNSATSLSSTEIPVVTNGDDEDLAAAEKAAASLARRKKRRQQVRVIREEIENLLAANRHKGAVVYAGFRFVQMAKQVSISEQSYLQAFVPLAVARRYPVLLVMQTLDVEEVFGKDWLPPGTRVIVRPGCFRTLKRECLGARAHKLDVLRFVWPAAGAIIAGLAAVGAAMIYRGS
ncbi:MAG TPA: hypothetical protein VGM05_11180 [Planctomycetaceae bacterium]|jgi:hypothetical protein